MCWGCIGIINGRENGDYYIITGYVLGLVGNKCVYDIGAI